MSKTITGSFQYSLNIVRFINAFILLGYILCLSRRKCFHISTNAGKDNARFDLCTNLFIERRFKETVFHK